MSDSNDTPPRPVPPDSPGGELFEAFHHIGREFLAGARRAINAGGKVAPEDRRALAQIRVAMESQLDELRGDQCMAYVAHFGVEVEDELELVFPFPSEETADAWAEVHEPEQHILWQVVVLDPHQPLPIRSPGDFAFHDDDEEDA